MTSCGIGIEVFTPTGTIVRGVFTELVGAVALVAGRSQVPEIDRVERIDRLRKV